MATNLYWVLSIAGGVIIAVLLAVILRLTKKLAAQQSQRESEKKKSDAQKQNLKMSIQVLCRSMIDEQVELSEGCLRVKLLLDHLSSDLHTDKRFEIFNSMYEQLKDMPTFEARKQTEPRLIKRLDERRFNIERENRDAILTASQALILYID